MPWEEVKDSEKARQLTKDIFGLGVDEESLLLQPDELEYEFDFNLDHYIVLAQIMLKIDLNLKKLRHELVPEMITEDNFWRNYFYRIECLKKDLQIEQCKLGARISREARQKLRNKQGNSDELEADLEDGIGG